MPFGRKKSLMDRAHDYVEQLSETVLPQLEAAWEQTVDKAGPALADARDKATPLIAEARATAAEKASVGAALAAEKASSGRDLATAKVNELRGVEPETKGGKLKKVLLLGGLLAIGGVVFSKLRAKKDTGSNWQSSYVPPAPPKPAKPAKFANPARVTKAATVIALLQREQGATLPELIEATGWLPHTTRAALTGLKKKGHVIVRDKRGEVTCYRIAPVAA